VGAEARAGAPPRTTKIVQELRNSANDVHIPSPPAPDRLAMGHGSRRKNTGGRGRPELAALLAQVVRQVAAE